MGFVSLRHLVEDAVGLLDLAAGSVKADELGGEGGAAAKDTGGDKAVEAGALAEGVHLGACLEEGRGEGGIEGNAVVEGDL